MAQITVTKIIDGPRNAVFHVAIAGTGAGELTDAVVIDPAASFDPAYPAAPTMAIDSLWYDLSGFDARLEFDLLTSDTLIWAMSGGQPAELCFRDFGGLKDRSGVDGAGKLKLTTRGLENGDHGTVIIKVKKD